MKKSIVLFEQHVEALRSIAEDMGIDTTTQTFAHIGRSAPRNPNGLSDHYARHTEGHSAIAADDWFVTMVASIVADIRAIKRELNMY